ncbi:MAG: anhydro-N-acetylmuramic acid kinase [Lentimonas sp.]
MTKHEIIGLMSGTSLDGLDLAHVYFTRKGEKWDFEFLNTTAYPYSKEWENRLRTSTELSAQELVLLDKEYGKLLGEFCMQFAKEKEIDLKKIDAISSHGHTVFHQPQKRYTLQVGCGVNLSMVTNTIVINDFRSKDVAHGGQGAPLVPIGEKHLLRDLADGFLNLGGFCNISIFKENEIVAFDISPCNLPLNMVAGKMGFDFDKNGDLARSGEINKNLLDELNQLEYFQTFPPKSLGTEWLDEHFLPLLIKESEPKNILKTLVENCAMQIGKTANDANIKELFVTGGGTKNGYLLERIEFHFKGKVIIPTEELVDYKEALVFAFMGALHLENEANCIPSVTGATKATVGGTLHKP